MLSLLEQRGAVPMTAGRLVFLGWAGRAVVSCDLIDNLGVLRVLAAWGDRDMNVITASTALSAALLWATGSIALEPKRPPSLPALELSCYMSHSAAFTTLENTGSELGIGGDNYGKPVYRFTTIDGALLKVVEFPEFDSMRKEYVKTISELRFDNTGSDYIFAWSDNEAMGLRIFVVNQRDRLVSLLEVPPGSQTLPFGTLRVLKCNDTANTASSASWLERGKGGNPILDVWRTSTATFPKPLPVRAQGSVSPRSSSREMASKGSPLNHQAGR